MDQIAELKQLIEEEKIAKRKRQAKWASNYRKDMSPEERAAYNVYKAERERINRRNKQAPTRPRPDACEACSKEGKVVYDHNHTTNAFRGWLCLQCNCTLGYVHDNPVVLEKLAEYIRHANSEQSTTEVNARDRIGVDPERQRETE